MGVPGNGTICLVIPDPVDGFGVTCTDTQTAVSKGLVAMLSGPSRNGRVQVTLLTTRLSSAKAVSGDGSEQPLTVDADGVVNAVLTYGSHIALRTPGGIHRIETPVPPPASPGPGSAVDQAHP